LPCGPGSSLEELKLIISCAHYLRANFGEGSAGVIATAETELIRRLYQCWEHAYLETVLEFLDISQKYALKNLRELALNVVADRHYVAFRLPP
uniref:NR LBD domain-containing protein n=1 Tax=Gongylonema pulchrum TaxID=637853 RepID=A0A183D3P2_9BILA